MNKLVMLIFMIAAPALASAEEPTRLQCEGKYSDYATSDVRDIELKGIYLEISGDAVKVNGALGLSGTYSVIGRPPEGFGLRLNGDWSSEGFLNRFSGALSLLGGVVTHVDGNLISAKRSLIGSCSRARALF